MKWPRFRFWPRKSTDVSALTWARLFGDSVSVKSGVSVTTDSALRVATVLACARVISEGVAQIPLKLYREREDGGKEVAYNHPLHRLLWRRPNEWQTSFEFRETLVFHAVLTGNGYAFINRVRGEVAELLPLLPHEVKVEQAADRSIVYRLFDRSGQIGALPRRDVLHLRGPSWNGYLGLDAVQQAREAIGLAIATEEAHARLHANGVSPAGVFSVDGNLDENQYKRLRAWIDQHYRGANRASPLILDRATKWTQQSMTGVDSEHLATRRYQVEEICRAMRVFPQMVMQSDKTSTYASAEQFFLAHVVHTLGPWIERVEQAIDRDLLGDGEFDLFAKMSVQGLLRGDARSRAEFYARLYQIGALSPNEIRLLEDLNPYEGGDEYRVPVNMEPPGQADDKPRPEPAPADPEA